MRKALPGALLRERPVLMWFLVTIPWAVWTLVSLLFMPSIADEGAYFYQVSRISAGDLPVLDFFTTHMPWAYLPFAAFHHWLSPHLEAARLVSLVTLYAVAGTVAVLTTRGYGHRLGLIAFTMIAGSWVWFSLNTFVAHSAPTNLALMTAFFTLVYRADRPAWLAFLSGLAAGIMVNARVVLFPVALLFFVFWFLDARHCRGTRAGSVAATLFAAGGLMASIPAFFLLIADFDAFLFDYLYSRLAWSNTVIAPLADGGLVGTAASRIIELKRFVSGDWSQNLTFMVPFAVAAVFALVPARGKSRTFLTAWWRDELVRRSAIVVVAIFASYSVADFFTAHYLLHVLPFLAMMGIGMLSVVSGETAVATESYQGWRRFAWVPAAAVLVPHVAVFAAHTAIDILRRNEPGIYRPTTIALVGCWLETQTPEGIVVADLAGAPEASARRRLPAGLDQGAGTTNFSWTPALPDETQRRFSLLPETDFMAGLESGRYPYYIHNDVIETVRGKGFLSDLPTIIEKNYKKITATGGVYPYTIYVHKSMPEYDYLRFTPWSPARLSKATVKELIERQAFASLAAHAITDATASLALLPGDIGSALARAFGAGYRERCGRLLAARGATQAVGKDESGPSSPFETPR